MSIFRQNDRVLIVAPHCDDEVLGCGGTIKFLADRGLDITLYIVTGHGDGIHPIWPKDLWDSIHNECENSSSYLGIKRTIYGNLPAVCLPDLPIYKVNEEIKSVLSQINPTVIFMPWKGDMHKDHEIINYALSVNLRPYLPINKSVRLVLSYEVLSETNLPIEPSNFSQFTPNFYIDISKYINYKLKAMEFYQSQLTNSSSPRSIEAIKALAKLRGVHVNKEFAEAFILSFCLES
ncbi:PIG-L domain-containing protein [Prochlorococcus marinus str. MU1402]|uniref:PIG-L deacetylase family protein n=1 Tax=Prochlorococcus marinus TaxID=1219 RepID=UPI001ADA5DAC|nr:PIG-L deacetylase family protein [Prochlorococcus marinus]MBO8232402.1 PIG-L family deacetylase [Prochlorococcus marinus XMU1402]MBW3057130.1 PIG-L domain-containing protein [Prochlorococcus marinus str. MU1402]